MVACQVFQSEARFQSRLPRAEIWNGRGSMGQVTLMQQQLLAQRASNQRTEAEIARLQSEVKDLKEGVDTVEAKARYELGMVKANEIFVQIAH